MSGDNLIVWIMIIEMTWERDRRCRKYNGYNGYNGYNRCIKAEMSVDYF